jgi:superfamily II DNA or RNA helicase
MEWFRNTPDAILNSVAMFTTGLDEPSIETVISNLSTLSVVKWLQMCGRGSRPTDFKSMFKIIDMGGNGVFHGDWNNNRDWLEVFNNPPKKGKNTVAPCKVCPECEALLFASVMKCEYCKYIFPRKVEGVEELLNNYVILTKNIDVEKIIVANSHKKTYYAFFQIVKKHANFFKLSGLVLTPELFKFVHERCFIDCRKWLHINGNKLSSFHKDLIIDELSKQLNYGNRILQTGN